MLLPIMKMAMKVATMAPTPMTANTMTATTVTVTTMEVAWAWSISKLCLGSWGLQSTRSTGVLGQHWPTQE